MNASKWKVDVNWTSVYGMYTPLIVDKNTFGTATEGVDVEGRASPWGKLVQRDRLDNAG